MEAEAKQPVLNAEQEAAAYCEENSVVAAGAGSGKTMVLASRYAWLVTEKNYRAAEILTLTFTKKAAAQMYRRIYLLLSEISREDPPGTPSGESGGSSDDRGNRARRALEEFTQARIQTLDSYSAAIVKQAANRYGLSPDFTIDEDRCYELALELAQSFLISRRNHPAMERLYPSRAPLSIATDLFVPALLDFTCIESPPRLLRDLAGQFTVIRGAWKKQSGVIKTLLNDLVEVYTGNENYHPDLAPLLLQFTEGKVVFPDEKELVDFFKPLPDIPDTAAIQWAESHPLHETLRGLLYFLASVNSLHLNKGSPRNNPAKELLKELRNLFPEFSSLVVFCLQAGLIHSVLSLLTDLGQLYIERKRAEGILTFADVARLAKTILLEQPDIRQSEKESFRAIMIDEFQDNNDLQRDLLFLLAENPEITNDAVPPAHDLSRGKLFFVGDEKQSIYRFRGADVTVFRKLKDDLGSRDLPLSTNYRSGPLLIAAFNAIFGGYEISAGEHEQGELKPENPSVFVQSHPSDTPADFPLYEASFSPLRSGKKSEGKLTVCILDKKDSDEFADSGDPFLSPVECEARYVAERIARLLEEKNEDGGQKYRPGDIAILFRSRTPQHVFEKHLMMLNIPYSSEDLNGFFFGGPVNDLMSVLRLAAYPADRSAYAQMLRSPFAGLSLPGLAACLTVSGPFGDEALPLLDEADREKYRNGQRVYRNIFAKAATESVSSLVSELWYREGYRYETEWNPQTAAYRELFDYLFHLASRADVKNQGLAEFTDSILNLYKSDERLTDIEIPLERSGAVQLLSVHKSKGLEFPVVFLCCCDKKGKNEYCGDLFDAGDSGLAFNPPLPPECEDLGGVKRSYFWERASAVLNGKRIAELRRLLYVAMTRAENELYLSGCLGVSKSLGVEGDDASGGGASDSDFSVLLKRYVEMKTEKAAGRNSIPGDTILEGSTFFGLCLPPLGANIPDEGLLTKPSFFTVERIPDYSERYLREAEQRGSRFPNNQKGLDAFFETVEPYYSRAEVIETPDLPRRHFTPLSLPFQSIPEKEGAYSGGAFSGDAYSDDAWKGDDASDVFRAVDILLDRYAAQNGAEGEKFSQRSFGTVAHLCVEALFADKEAFIPPELAGYLKPDDADAFLAAGKELARRFIRSPLGIIAGKSKQRRSEFPFRSLVYDAEKQEIFISGIIDLVFEDSETVYVVDFKTDKNEVPEEHIPQMASYYRTASELFALPQKRECRIWLYYLRSGRAVEVSAEAKNLNAEYGMGNQELIELKNTPNRDILL